MEYMNYGADLSIEEPHLCSSVENAMHAWSIRLLKLWGLWMPQKPENLRSRLSRGSLSVPIDPRTLSF